jgi:hypothetical protein
MSAQANAAFQNFDDERDGKRSELADRRGQFRDCFVAAAEVTEPLSGAVIAARTDNLSSGGCFVDTPTPFRTGTVVDLRLIKDNVAFETQATVVASQPKLGMSLAFDPAEEDQRCILEMWLNSFDGGQPAEQRITEQGTVEQQESEPEEEEEIEQDSSGQQRLVLNQLIITLLRKGILSEEEAKTLLGPLFT